MNIFQIQVFQYITLIYIDYPILTSFMQLAEMSILRNGICIIEWGELIEEILPKEYLKISFLRDLENENLRILNITPFGDRFKNILERVL